jgi:DNA-cytosine methyltransferase
MKYLSLFSGIGGFELALHKNFPDATCLGFSEVDKAALTVYQSHFPFHPCLGDVNKIDFKQFEGQVDLVVGGFPCQNLSTLNPKDRKGLQGEKSKLFFQLLRCLQECKPRFFIAENVASMSIKNKTAISKLLGVNPVEINACHFTAQTRRRLFWCNFQVKNVNPRESKDIEFIDILEPCSEVKKLACSLAYQNYLFEDLNGKTRMERYPTVHDSSQPKSRPLPVGYSGHIIRDKRFNPELFRKLTPKECERLQGFQDDYTIAVCNTSRYRLLGNAVCVPVVEHICLSMKSIL